MGVNPTDEQFTIRPWPCARITGIIMRDRDSQTNSPHKLRAMRHAANPQQRQEWHRPIVISASGVPPVRRKVSATASRGYLHPHNQGGSFLIPHPQARTIFFLSACRKDTPTACSLPCAVISNPEEHPVIKTVFVICHPQFFALTWGIFNGLTSQLFQQFLEIQPTRFVSTRNFTQDPDELGNS